jgi:iron complex outermembrane recepter protein
LIGGVGYTHSELGSGSAGPLFKGRQVPNVPSWSANAAIQYETPLDALGLSGEFSATAELQYVNSRVADVQQSFDLRHYSVVNLRAGWKNEQGDFEVYGFARDLFHKRYEVYGASLSGAPVVMTATGRIVGMGITKR